MVAEAMAEDLRLSVNAAVKRTGTRVGIVPDTLRNWVKQQRVDAGQEPGPSPADAKRIKDLQAEVRELRRGQRDPAGGQLVLRAGARPATALVVAFIDGQRDRITGAG